MILRGFQQERDGFRRDRSNFVTESGCELGIEREHFKGESDFIRYTLTGAVSAAEKLKILVRVVRADAVDVMDRFFGAQWAAKTLLHSVTVFQNFSRGFSVRPSDDQTHIAVTRGMWDGDTVDVCDLHSEALLGASALRTAHDAPPSSITGSELKKFSAVGAVSVVVDAASLSAAFDRAIHRPSAVFFDVASEHAGFPSEDAAAVFASEVRDRRNFLQRAVSRLVFSVALSAAKLVRRSGVTALVGYPAVIAVNYQRITPFLLEQKREYHAQIGLATAFLAGVA